MDQQENRPVCFHPTTGEPVYATPEQTNIMNLIHEQNYDQIEQLLMTGQLDPNMTFGVPGMLPYTCLLTRAAHTGNINLVRLFLDHGANANISVKDYPINGAIYTDNLNMAKLIIEHTNNIFNTHDLFTPLHVAASVQVSDELAKLIIDHTDNLDARTLYGLTALHTVAMTNNFIVAKRLIETGANIHLLTGNGETALDIARTNGFDMIVGLIESCDIPDKGVHE